MRRKQWFSTSEAAELLHLSPRSVLRLCNDGILSYTVFGKSHRSIPRSSIFEYLRKKGEDTSFMDANRVLVVDEDKAFRRQVATICEKRGWDCRCATSGAAAILECSTFNPDVALVELSLPLLSGKQFMTTLHASPLYSGIYVIGVSDDPKAFEGRDRSYCDDCLPKPAPADYTEAKIQKALGAWRVLLVDDHNGHNAFLREVLCKQHDAFVRCARNGTEALQIIATIWPDIIVLDELLPDVNGSEIVKTIRQEADLRYRKIKILGFSGAASAEKAMRAAGADGFLVKPFDPVALQEAIVDLMAE